MKKENRLFFSCAIRQHFFTIDIHSKFEKGNIIHHTLQKGLFGVSNMCIKLYKVKQVNARTPYANTTKGTTEDTLIFFYKQPPYK